MKIKITDKACGLEVGKEYDLCDMAAKGLIQKRQAVLFTEPVEKEAIGKEPEKPAVKAKTTKGSKGKTDESNTK
jgi:hypothetical protein